MALVTSNMMELGTQAPDFTLPDTVSGEPFTLSALDPVKATVILFICNHCPYVHHINFKLVEVANTYQAKGMRFIAISSNDVSTHPQDAPELMTQVAKKEGYPFPYLFDATQEVAKAYSAECTPDLFVFDADLKCTYRGRFDETRPNIEEATGSDLARALDALLAGVEMRNEQYPSMGCSIKWKG